MRLIDADILKKELSKMEDEYKSTLNENCNDDPFSDGVLSALFTVFNTINNQPTAFDVDKVREQLEELRVNAFNDEVMIINEAIEVVKAGGRDD